MATGPKVLGADFDDTNVAGDSASFHTPSDAWWFIKRLVLQRRDTSLNGRLEVEVHDLDSPKAIEVTSNDEYAKIADDTAFSVISGDDATLDVRVAAKPGHDWTLSTQYFLAGRWDFNNDAGWQFYVNSGDLRLLWEEGGGGLGVQGTAVSSGQDRRLYRATLDCSGSATDATVTFYSKPFDADTLHDDLTSHTGWTQMDQLVDSGSSTLNDGAQDFVMGVHGTNRTAGDETWVYGCALYGEVGTGDPIVDVVMGDADEGATSFTERSSNAFTVTAENGGEFASEGSLVHRRKFSLSSTTNWDGDSLLQEDDPLIVLPPDHELRFIIDSDVTTSDWVAAQAIGVEVDPSNHKFLSERVIPDDVLSTFTCPVGADWAFPHLMGMMNISDGDTEQVHFRVAHPTDDTYDQQSYSASTMRDGSDELGYKHEPHARMFRDGMYLEVDYSSASTERWLWLLLGQEST